MELAPGREAMSASSTGSGRSLPERRRVWSYGPVTIALASTDAGAADWLAEVLEPWFKPTLGAAQWHVRLSSSPAAHAELRARRPAAAPRRACFAFDQSMLSLPAWRAGERVILDDAERSCFLAVAPSQLEIYADPSTRRWRMTSMWALHEIAATRLRRTQLDLHAATVEAAGRALLISGPKGAGKTTLFLHLLRSGHHRPIANDRAFVGEAATSFLVRGVPTAVKIRAPTMAEFPEVGRGLPGVERPYLYTLGELAAATEAPRSAPDELTLSPAQLLHQFGVQAVDAAPLGAVVFPHVRVDADGWALERLDTQQVDAALWANLYGSPVDRAAATIFEDVEGGPTPPSRQMAQALSAAAPGYRLVLGRDAYADPELAVRLRQIVDRP
jgi:hypothetical protein